MDMSKLGLSSVGGVVLGALGTWLTMNYGQPPDAAAVDPVMARAAVVRANCALSETERAVYREQLQAVLVDDGHCSMDWCKDDDHPAVCPQGTPLAATGEPVEVPMDEIVEREKLREEVKEEVELEIEANKAAAAEAVAADVEPEPPKE